MSKLRGSTALSRRKKKEKKSNSPQNDVNQTSTGALSDNKNSDAKNNSQSDKTKDKITTVSTRRNVTTGSSPVPLRLTANDKAELNLWLAELEAVANKPISSAKLMRGLIHMRSKINTKKLIEAIKEIS